jgi:enoyl-CoA hydratase
MQTVTFESDGPVAVITLQRPARRNAVDLPTATALYQAVQRAEADEAISVTVLTGAGGHFCGGADLKAMSEGDGSNANRVSEAGEFGPMGPTRMQTLKPVIAAVEGYAVAGGLELACWADLRVAGESAVFGVFCRRFGVPLIDLGTIRLPRLIGASRAMDLILTGRPVGAAEALQMGLANRVVADGQALAAAVELAHQIARFPQTCLRNDRKSALEQWSLPWDEATLREVQLGLATLRSGEGRDGAARFTSGQGRGGAFA